MIIIFLISILAPCPAFSQTPVQIIVNGKKISGDTEPQIVNNRVMVTLKFIAETLGAAIKWDNRTKQVNISGDGIKASLSLSGDAYKNGEKIFLDQPAIIENGRILVPIRFVTTSLGLHIIWDNIKKIVYLYSTELKPEEVINLYCQFLLGRQYGMAYDLLTKDNKNTITKSDFISYMELFDKQFIEKEDTLIEKGKEFTDYVIGGVTYSKVMDFVLIQKYINVSTDKEEVATLHRKVVKSNGNWKVCREDLSEMYAYLDHIRNPEIGMSREKPLPLGKSMIVPGEVQISVQNSIKGREAWNFLHDANSSNDPPEEGYMYVLIVIKAKNVSSEDKALELSNTNFRLSGSSNTIFTPSEKNTILPENGPYKEFKGEVYPEGEITGSVSFYVPENETNLIIVWIFGSQKDQRFFNIE
ncbi:MAG: stalk domain-containing protein [Eubacteriales bacterium]